MVGRDVALDVRALVKRYRGQPGNAVDGLSFSVANGEVFGLLGPNGAGKTTTIAVLTTRARATSGEAYVAGIDVRRQPVAARTTLAVVPQHSNLDRSLTARQNLEFHAAYHGVARRVRRDRAAQLLEEFGLTDRADHRVDWLSGGMAQRIMIARALMHIPRVLFLDEPTAGLDPQSRLFLWSRVRELSAEGVAVVITTHDIHEAADQSDRVGIVDHGRLLALDTPMALIKGLGGHSMMDLTIVSESADEIRGTGAALRELSEVDRVEHFGQHSLEASVRLHLNAPGATVLGAVAAVVAARCVVLAEIRVVQPSLEDVFVELTGRGLR